MKTKVRIALIALLGITLFVVGLPISSAAPNRQGERMHAKKGREVGSRVRQLQKYNSCLVGWRRHRRSDRGGLL